MGQQRSQRNASLEVAWMVRKHSGMQCASHLRGNCAPLHMLPGWGHDQHLLPSSAPALCSDQLLECINGRSCAQVHLSGWRHPQSCSLVLRSLWWAFSRQTHLLALRQVSKHLTGSAQLVGPFLKTGEWLCSQSVSACSDNKLGCRVSDHIRCQACSLLATCSAAACPT